MLSRRVQYLEEAHKFNTSISETMRNQKEEISSDMQDLYTSMQYVYGRVNADDVEGAPRGTSILLHYPQFKDDDDRVFMYMKSVDANTARIELTPVCIFDPSAEVPHRVSDFSATPHA